MSSFALMNRAVNPLVRAVLRSPLHGLLDRSIMLLTVKGRRSGRAFTFPAQYVRDGDAVWILVGRHQDKRWWRNLSGDGHVRVRVGGRDLEADAHVADGRSEPAVVGEGLRAFAARWPAVAERYAAPSQVVMVRVSPSSRS